MRGRARPHARLRGPRGPPVARPPCPAGPGDTGVGAAEVCTCPGDAAPTGRVPPRRAEAELAPLHAARWLLPAGPPMPGGRGPGSGRCHQRGRCRAGVQSREQGERQGDGVQSREQGDEAVTGGRPGPGAPEGECGVGAGSSGVAGGGTKAASTAFAPDPGHRPREGVFTAWTCSDALALVACPRRALGWVQWPRGPVVGQWETMGEGYGVMTVRGSPEVAALLNPKRKPWVHIPTRLADGA